MKGKSQSMINGAVILVIGTVLVKIIGAVFKIPLTTFIGATGRGYFSAAYNIYVPLYAVALAGLPTAVSKLVSQSMALGQTGKVKAIKAVSTKLFLITGTVGTLVLIALAYPYGKYIAGTVNVVPSILMIAPSIFFCCLMSAYRGYFEGMQNMTPTAVSQVVEAVAKLVLGLLFAFLTMEWLLQEYTSFSTVLGKIASSEKEAMSMIYPFTSCAAVAGVTAGTVFGWIYLLIVGKRNKLVSGETTHYSQKAIAKELIIIAIPIILGSLIQNMSNLIDTATIQNRLEYALSNDSLNIIGRMYAQSFSVSGTVAEDVKTYLFGVYNSALDFKNLVPTVTLALGISSLPAMSRSWALKHKGDLTTIISAVIKYSVIISAPIGFGMAFFPTQLLSVIYGSNNSDIVPIAAPIVKIYGMFMVVFALSAPVISMLQAIGKASFTVKTMAVGAVIKIVMNFVLVGNPYWNINGAPVSTICCYSVIIVANVIYLIKETKVKFPASECIFKPIFAAFTSCFAAKLVFDVICSKTSLLVSLSIVIIIAIIFYLFLLIVLKIITKNDAINLFKSEKMALLLEKLRTK